LGLISIKEDLALKGFLPAPVAEIATAFPDPAGFGTSRLGGYWEAPFFQAFFPKREDPLLLTHLATLFPFFGPSPLFREGISNTLSLPTQAGAFLHSF